MASVTHESWEQFYDRVVVRGRNWPRSLWFAAVEDGLRSGIARVTRRFWRSIARTLVSWLRSSAPAPPRITTRRACSSSRRRSNA